MGLPCILRNITGCLATFKVDDRDIWKSHSVFHYGEEGPPAHSLCIFCDAAFDPSSSSIPWLDRMDHIAEHFENGWNLDYSHLDWAAVRYMQSRINKRISKGTRGKDKVNREKRNHAFETKSPGEKRMRVEGGKEEITRRAGRAWLKGERLG
jgi:hypothetical protein